MPRAAHHRVPHQQLGELRRLPADTRAGGRDDALGHFDHVIESSKVGVRKPDPRFYELACETCGVRPDEAVFLDDLGVNLKPAAAMGMTTIKVVEPGDALADLEAVGSSRSTRAIGSDARAAAAQELGLLLGVDGVGAGGRAARLVARHPVDRVACRRSARRAGP